MHEKITNYVPGQVLIPSIDGGSKIRSWEQKNNFHLEHFRKNVFKYWPAFLKVSDLMVFNCQLGVGLLYCPLYLAHTSDGIQVSWSKALDAR